MSLKGARFPNRVTKRQHAMHCTQLIKHFLENEEKALSLSRSFHSLQLPIHSATYMQMKTVGLIGGLSWHSSAEYYRIINEETQKRCGELNSSKIILYSFNFQEIVDLQDQNRWDLIEERIIQAGRTLAAAGAELVAFGANTTHRFADAFEKSVSIPLIHIADVTAQAIRTENFQRVGLLGTQFTMELDFYKCRLAKHGIEALVPTQEQRQQLHSIIYSELTRGVIRHESRTVIVDMIEDLKRQGAEGVILGCTELPLIVRPQDSPITTFDTTRIHAEAIVEAAF